MELNINEEILTHNKLLMQTIDNLTKQLTKLQQQSEEMHETPKHKHIAFYEICNGDYPIVFSLQLMNKSTM